jgi:hypothetical protein
VTRSQSGNSAPSLPQPHIGAGDEEDDDEKFDPSYYLASYVEQEEQDMSRESEQHSHHSTSRKRPSSIVESVSEKRMQLKTLRSSPTTQYQTDGLRADILVVELYKWRKQGAGLSEAFSPFACELNYPKPFLSAIRKTLVNAFEISRSVDVTQYSWSRDGQVQPQSYQIDLDISWDKNLMNLKTANKKLIEDQVQYRLMEYQQKWLVEKEIERRTASGVTVKRAELDVLTELGESLDPPGNAAPAQSKSRLGLKTLFAIDERYLAFILTRSISDSK